MDSDFHTPIAGTDMAAVCSDIMSTYVPGGGLNTRRVIRGGLKAPLGNSTYRFPVRNCCDACNRSSIKWRQLSS